MDRKDVIAMENYYSAASFKTAGKSLIISFNADIDHHSSILLRYEADRLIEKTGISNIIFDFTGVDFMDSSGIGVIMGRCRKVAYMGGRVAAVNVTRAADRILLLSGLYRLLPKYNDLNEAIAAFDNKNRNEVKGNR